MHKPHVLFKKNCVDFFLNIDNKSFAHSVGIISGSSRRFTWYFIKTLRNLQLITTKPLQLTKKGELLRKRFLRIYSLLNK